MLPESLDIDESLVSDLDAYPITLTVRHLSDDESNPNGYAGDATGTRSGLFRSSLLSAEEEEALYQQNGAHDERVEVVKAKYLVGCDGAHSWTRRQLGIKMIGDQTTFVWGVLDMIPLTNFVRLAPPSLDAYPLHRADVFARRLAARHPHALRRPLGQRRLDHGHPAGASLGPFRRRRLCHLC